ETSDGVARSTFGCVEHREIAICRAEAQHALTQNDELARIRLEAAMECTVEGRVGDDRGRFSEERERDGPAPIATQFRVVVGSRGVKRGARLLGLAEVSACERKKREHDRVRNRESFKEVNQGSDLVQTSLLNA